MEDMTTLRIELGISAQKIMHQLQLHHGNIEEQIAKGIELAINDLMEGDNFVEQIRSATKQELATIVNKAVLSWEVQNKISKLVSEKINDKIEIYADALADKITSSLK